MTELDWTDIALHALGGLTVALVMVLPPWAVLTLNAAFWTGREAWQRIEKNQPMARLFQEPQVLLEWIVPSIVAPLVWLGLSSI